MFSDQKIEKMTSTKIIAIKNIPKRAKNMNVKDTFEAKIGQNRSAKVLVTVCFYRVQVGNFL